jgi:outer membrane protein assembly factor BamB
MRLRFSLVVLLAAGASAADWPQWRGPGRDGLVAGLAARAEWPASLKQAWRVGVGLGHSSPLVAGERVYAFTREGGEEVVQAVELATGKRIWRQGYPAPYSVNPAAASHGPGPKATAVLADGRLFTYGIGGILSAFDAASGRPLWRKDFAGQYRSTSPLYGSAASPVVDGGRVIANLGGNDDGALAAFDVATGAPRWSWKGDGPGYASPVLAEVGGVRQVITESQTQLVGLDAETGAFLWKIPFTTEWVQNAVTPIVRGDLIVYSGLDHPLKAVRLAREAGAWVAKPVWENAEVTNYMSTPVRAEGRIFGLSSRKKGQLFCLDEATGKTIWLSEGRQGDNAALIAGGGAVFVLSTEGELVVLAAAAPRFAPLRRYTVAPSATWAHPALLPGGVVVKDLDSLGYWKWE